MAVKELALITEKKKRKKKESVQAAPTKPIKETISNNKGTTKINRSTISTKPSAQKTPQNRVVTNKERLTSKPTISDIRTVKTSNFKPKSIQTVDLYERGGRYFYKDGKKEKEVDQKFVQDALKNKRTGVIGRYDSKGTLRATDKKGNVKKQSLLDKAGFLGRTAGTRAIKGTTSIVDAALQETQNDLQKGKDIKSPLAKLSQLTKAIMNADPRKGMESAIVEAAQKSKAIWKDKDKNILEKYIGSVMEGSQAVSTGATKGVKDLTSLVGSYDKNLDKEVAKVQKKIDEPVNKEIEKLEREKYKYGKGMRTASDIVGTTANMAPGIIASAVTRNPNIGIATMGLSAKGQATEEALKQGADLDTAVKMGTTKGLVEAGTEKLSSGLKIFGKGPTGKWLNEGGTLDDLIEGTLDKKIKNKGMNFLAKQGFGLTGEIAEETISDLAGVMIDKGTINPDANYTWEDFLETAKNTFGSTLLTNLLTGGYGSGAYRQNTINMQNNQIKQAQLEEIGQKVESGEVTQDEVRELVKQVENGTYSQNNNLDTIAIQQKEQLDTQLQQGLITDEQYNQELIDIANATKQTREQINTPQQDPYEEMRNRLRKENKTTQETQNVSKNEQNEGTQESAFNNETKKDNYEELKKKAEKEVVKTTSQKSGKKGRMYQGKFYSEEHFNLLDDDDIKLTTKLKKKQEDQQKLTKKEEQQVEYLKRKREGLKNPELNPDIKGYSDIKADYKYTSEYKFTKADREKINKALDIVSANKQKRRTKQQWLDVANNIGLQSEKLDSEALKNIAFGSWTELSPNQKEVLNRQGAKYVPFSVDEWVKAVYKGAGVGTKIKEETNQTTQPKQEKPIQGLESYTRQEIKDITKDYIQSKLSEAGIDDVNIEGIEIHGSRARGTANQDSDLDVVVEYSGNVREDSMFNMLNEEKLNIDGIDIDINPITKEKTGNLESYMENSNQYDKEIIGKKNENIPAKTSENVIKADDIVKDFNEAKDGNLSDKKLRSYIETSNKATNMEDTIDKADLDKITYEVKANKDTYEKAQRNIKDLSYDERVARSKNILNSDKKIKAVDMAEAQIALLEAAQSGRVEDYLSLQQDIAIMGTELGQTVQAMSMIQKMSPDGQIATLMKIIKRKQATDSKIWKDVELKPELVQKVLDSYDDASHTTFDKDKMDQAVDELKQDLADQMKVTKTEKLNEWRYLSMLGNPKTHIRNLTGNVAMSVVKAIKDTISAGTQDAAGKLGLIDKSQKTATLKRASKEVKDLSGVAFDEMMKIGDKSGKYNESGAIEEKRQIFKNKVLESLRKGNLKALNVEDNMFKKVHFKNAFSTYLTAKGIKTLEDINNNPQIVADAKVYAMNEAKIATFQQENKGAKWIRDLDKLGWGAQAIRGAIVPFTGVPMNIAQTGIEYTPGVGMIPTISAFKKAPKGQKGIVLIDGLAKQMTGSSLLLLGYALAKSGLVNADAGDDKDDKYKKDLGEEMNYSIKIGDTSYDLSWLSPSAMPFFVGASAYEQWEKREGLDANFITEALASTVDPLSEMSVVESFTKVLSSYESSGAKKIMDAGESTVQSYISQYIPTAFSQFSRALDSKKRNTYADKNSKWTFGEETGKQLAFKTPFRLLLPEQTDYFGKTKMDEKNNVSRALQAFFSPINTRKDTSNEVSKELLKLYDKTGETEIIPGKPDSYLKYNDEKYDMTQKEYNKFKKVYGTTASKEIKRALNDSDYQNLSIDKQAQVISNILKYSKNKAKEDYFESKDVDYTNTKFNKAKQAEESGYVIADYYITKKVTAKEKSKSTVSTNRYEEMKGKGVDGKTFDEFRAFVSNARADKTANGGYKRGSKKQKIINYINKLPLSAKQKQALWDDYNENTRYFQYYG